MSSFRHEKFVPKGGPNGGDGGQGGNVILVADRNVNTLVDFRYRRLFKAKPGGKGQGSISSAGMPTICSSPFRSVRLYATKLRMPFSPT